MPRRRLCGYPGENSSREGERPQDAVGVLRPFARSQLATEKAKAWIAGRGPRAGGAPRARARLEAATPAPRSLALNGRGGIPQGQPADPRRPVCAVVPPSSVTSGQAATQTCAALQESEERNKTTTNAQNQPGSGKSSQSAPGCEPCLQRTAGKCECRELQPAGPVFSSESGII